MLPIALSLQPLLFPLQPGQREMRGYLHSEGAHCILAEIPGMVAGFILTLGMSILASVTQLGTRSAANIDNISWSRSRLRVAAVLCRWLLSFAAVPCFVVVACALCGFLLA